MPTCNIDSKGKVARLITGILTLAAATALLIFWALPMGGWIAWTLTILATAAGLFQVYEARSGWCIVRAMGFKTPI